MTFFKKDELRLLWPFYFSFLVLRPLEIIWPFFIVYLREIGLSFTQIGILLSVYGASKFLFEIPTGVVADVFGRKLSTLVGVVLMAVSFAGIGYVTDFLPLLLLFALWSFATTFISGAQDAWVVDLIKSRRKQHLVDEYYTKYHSFGSLSYVLAGILGAYVVQAYGIVMIWPVTAVSYALTGVLLLVPEERFVRKTCTLREHARVMVAHTWKSFRYASGHKTLRIYYLAVVFVGLAMGFAADNIWYPLLDVSGFPKSWLGLFFSATVCVGVVIPYVVKWFARLAGGYARYLAIMLFVIASLVFLGGMASGLWMIVGICFFYFSSWSFVHPARNIFFQKQVPSRLRATLSSTETMLLGLGSSLSLLAAGVVADSLGLQASLIIGGLIFLPGGLMFWKMGKR